MPTASRVLRATLALCAGIAPAVTAAAQRPADSSAVAINGAFRTIADIVYRSANNYDARLDVYTPRVAVGPLPTLVYIHGGGWTGGSKESAALELLPYLAKGWAAVNVEYRLADPTVPYQHAVRLKQALDTAGVANELVTIPGGGHGRFQIAQSLRAYAAIDAFLRAHGIAASVETRTD